MLIAITGGIGMGKTTVLKDFQELGAVTMDADDVAHSLYEPGKVAYSALIEHYGESILDAEQRINRKEVGLRVFQNASELAWLNNLLHPLIRKAIEQTAKTIPDPVYCAVPLLYESGWESDADAVIGVWCSNQVQHERLKGRGWDDAEIERRISSQLPADEKLRRADYAIMTHCSWEQLRQQCQAIHKQILGNVTRDGARQ